MQNPTLNLNLLSQGQSCKLGTASNIPVKHIITNKEGVNFAQLSFWESSFVQRKYICNVIINLRVISIPNAFKLIKDAVIFIQRAQLASQIIMYTVNFYRLLLHGQIPNFDCQIIPSDHVAPIMTKSNIRYR